MKKLIFGIFLMLSTLCYSQSHRFIIDKAIIGDNYKDVNSELLIEWDQKNVKLLFNEQNFLFKILNAVKDDKVDKVTLDLVGKMNCTMTVHFDGRYKNITWLIDGETVYFHFSQIFGK